jgi:DNA-binding NarL/FixJ family response regulator
MAIKVLLADDADAMRRSIRRLLHAYPEIELIGEAADYDQAIQMTNDLKPHVVVLDLHMPDETQFTVDGFKSHLKHQPLLLAISIWQDDNAKELAQSIGAVTLLDKMELARTLVPAIMQSVLPNK